MCYAIGRCTDLRSGQWCRPPHGVRPGLASGGTCHLAEEPEGSDPRADFRIRRETVDGGPVSGRLEVLEETSGVRGSRSSAFSVLVLQSWHLPPSAGSCRLHWRAKPRCSPLRKPGKEEPLQAFICGTLERAVVYAQIHSLTEHGVLTWNIADPKPQSKETRRRCQSAVPDGKALVFKHDALAGDGKGLSS